MLHAGQRSSQPSLGGCVNSARPQCCPPSTRLLRPAPPAAVASLSGPVVVVQQQPQLQQGGDRERDCWRSSTTTTSYAAPIWASSGSRLASQASTSGDGEVRDTGVGGSRGSDKMHGRQVVTQGLFCRQGLKLFVALGKDLCPMRNPMLHAEVFCVVVLAGH